MTTKKAVMILEQINPIIKKSTSYVRRLEIDEEDKSIKFMTFFGDVIHRHYYSQNTNAIDLCSDIFEWLDWRC